MDRAQRSIRIPSNNIELVASMMEFSDHGPLAQMFIVDAIRKLSEAVASKPIEELREQMKENGFISAEAWQGVAIEIKEKMEKFYNRHQPTDEPG